LYAFSYLPLYFFQSLSSNGAIAVHTTCYEQKMKVMGLKVQFLL
jgi:hypothetical protein